MEKAKLLTKDVSFRPARLEDAKSASRLLFEAFPKKATFIIGLGSEERAKRILNEIFSISGHRLSYEFTLMVIHNGRVVGAMLAFPGKTIGRLNRQLYQAILKKYKLRGKLALVLRAWPLIFVKEAARDEYFLSNLVVRKKYRGRGIGKKLLQHVETQAKEAGFSKISLMVALDNQDARRFYDRHGYIVNAITLESNRRVPHLGPGYQRRVKDLGN